MDYIKVKKDKMQEKEKKPNNRKVGETGGPGLMSKFEEAMQKERDFVLNRAKQREKAEKSKTPSVNIKRVAEIIKKKGAAPKVAPMKEAIKTSIKEGNSENSMMKALLNKFKS
jgi:hypothetical protein